MGRTVVEGESPYKLAPGVHGEGEAEESESDVDEAGSLGTVYRVTRGQLRKLEGGMEQYSELAARTAARLGKTANAG